jgi:adenosine deaminase
MKLKKILLTIIALLLCSSVWALDNTAKTRQYFDKIKHNPEALQVFLQSMPKGADLHLHIDGAVYAEHLIHYAAGEHFCIHPKTFAVYQSKHCATRWHLAQVAHEPQLYDEIIDAWSMRDFPLDERSGEAHFFDSFVKFEPLIGPNLAPIIAGIVNRAGREQEIYMELMIGGEQLKAHAASGLKANQIGAKVSPQPRHLAAWRKQLRHAGIAEVVKNTVAEIKQLQDKVQHLLKCHSKQAQPGCDVTFRYQYFALRDIPLPQFYAQLVTAFAVADKSPYVVGVNIVMPENWQKALHNYHQEMLMIQYLHQLHPKVNITLHSGELTFKQVPPKALTSHIRQAINVAHAQRIGHGVDITYEHDSQQLLQQMAQQHIDVEVNLTSNAQVLGVKGNKHPLPLFLAYHVPVTLSTDDEGVERTDLTHEFKRAIMTYNLTYSTVKKLVRNSLTYAFMPGKSLWQNPDTFTLKPVCKDSPLGGRADSACLGFLNKNPKARLQWRLEQQFKAFEAKWPKANH